MGATILKPRNIHGLLPTLPVRVHHFPLIASPGYTNNKIETSTPHGQDNFLVHEREVLHVSGTYHSSSIDGIN
jgi:hypothetical protein